MKKENLETLSACYRSLKAIQNSVSGIMSAEEEHYEQLSQSEQEGEPGETLGFEIDALDNIDYLMDQVISFIEENLGDRLQGVDG